MELIPFIAETPEDAVAQIRTRLGPDAVVVSVRQLPASNLSRLWRKPRMEVVAHRGTPAPATAPVPSMPAPMPAPRQAALVASEPMGLKAMEPGPMPAGPDDADGELATAAPGWRITRLLKSAGFSAVHAHQVADRMRKKHGTMPPPSLLEEIGLARSTLLELWRTPPMLTANSPRPQVLVGAPGAGKTTVLCKWLTQAVLVDGASADVWRLDGATANTADFLEMYCSVLQVPVERSWDPRTPSSAPAFGAIDLPGVDWRRPEEIQALAEQLRRYHTPHVHLVLNAAYDSALLLAQVRAFSVLPVEDLIFTHLDEEIRWGRIWNVALGTKLPVRFFSAGKNVPGGFSMATAEDIISRQFPPQLHAA